MTKMRRLFLAMLPMLLASACDGDGDADGIPIGELGNQATDKICAYGVRCGLFPDKASCVSSARPEVDQLTADVNSGKIKYDGSAAADCLNVFGRRPCEINDQTDNDPQSCRDAFKGTIGDGAACFDNEQCISERCNRTACDLDLTCCAGTCDPQAAANIAIGADCSPPDSVCVDGAYCKRDVIGAPTICAAKVATGQPCVLFDECVPGTFCSFDQTSGTGTCAKAPALGEPCPRGFCNAFADTCDETTGRCVRRTAVGGACTAEDGCVPYARCEPATMTCVAQSLAGGACTTGDECLGNLECTTAGTCALTPADPICP